MTSNVLNKDSIQFVLGALVPRLKSEERNSTRCLYVCIASQILSLHEPFFLITIRELLSKMVSFLDILFPPRFLLHSIHSHTARHMCSAWKNISPLKRIWVSSVSIASDYRLGDRVRSLAEAKDFLSSLCIQTSSEAHPASCTMGTRRPFLGVKRGRGLTLTIQPHLVPRSRKSRNYTSSLPWRLYGGSGAALLFTLLFRL
jgi:hypothetical protein